MLVKASDFLREAAAVEEQCALLLALSETLNDDQHRLIQIMSTSAARLSALVVETKDILESTSHQIIMLGHPLRSLIAQISAYAQILSDDSCGPVSRNQEEYSERIGRHGEKLWDLLQEITDNADPIPKGLDLGS